MNFCATFYFKNRKNANFLALSDAKKWSCAKKSGTKQKKWHSGNDGI